MCALAPSLLTAGTLQQSLHNVAAQAGLTSGAAEPAEILVWPLHAGELLGTGVVRGRGSLMCSSYGPQPGAMAGTIIFSGKIPVSGSGGFQGEIRVSARVLVTGTCQFGQGTAVGLGTVTGSGPVYDADGKPAGIATVSGDIFVKHEGGTFAVMRQTVTVAGRVQP